VALTHQRVQDTSSAIEQIATEAIELITRLRRALKYNSDQAIDWGAATTPSYITETPAGNLEGRAYSRQAVSNAVGSLVVLSDALSDAHVGNLNQLARPLASR
jgi:hypothetical protein